VRGNPVRVISAKAFGAQFDRAVIAELVERPVGLTDEAFGAREVSASRALPTSKRNPDCSTSTT